MTRSGEQLPGALVLRTYGELDQFVGAFAEGLLNLLVIVGRPGVQKSHAVRAAVGRRACWIDGNATAFGLYCQLYRHRDRPVVIDDVEYEVDHSTPLADAAGEYRQLPQTEQERLREQLEAVDVSDLDDRDIWVIGRGLYQHATFEGVDDDTDGTPRTAILQRPRFTASARPKRSLKN